MNMFHLRKGTETMIEFYKRGVLKILVLTILGLALPISIFSQDTSCGIIWYPAIQLSDSTHNAYQPRIALSGDDTVHVTWWEDAPPGVRLPYIRSTSSGQSFESVREMLLDTVAYPYQAFRPHVLASGDDVYLFFITPEPFNSKVRMLYSSDKGTTFGVVKDISTDEAGEVTWAAINDVIIVLIYNPNGRKIICSTNRGLTWTRKNEVLNDHAKVTLTTGNLHLVQHTVRGGAAEIEYRRSSNLGDSWQIDTVLSEVDGWYSDIPTIAGYTSKCGTELLTAWRDMKYGCVYCFLGASIISRVGLLNGNLWLPENVLTENEPKGTEPQVAVNQNVRGVTWMDEIIPADTYHVAVRASNSSLMKYCPKSDLTPIERAILPQIAVSHHAIHVVWHQEDNNGNFRIFYRRGEFIPKDVNFSLSTGFLEIDTTEIGRTKTDTIRVANTGSDTMIIGTAISDNETFTVTPYDTTVAPFSETVFKVSFTPKRYGKHSGKIIFYHNGQSSPDCFDVTGTATWRKETISYRQGEWNMVSIPMKPGPVQSLPSMFSYEGSYIPRDTILFGKGYWSKPAAEVDYYGVDIWSDTFAVKSGWNMIGSLTGEVLRSDITTIPENIITSLFYIFDGEKYVPADTLKPGRSYWIKVKQDGKLILK